MDGGLRIYNVEPLSEKARIGESIYNVVILITFVFISTCKIMCDGGDLLNM